jgi:hypothetical protein
MAMEVTKNADKTIFFHVLKTGGMTFQAILSAIYGEAFHIVNDPSLPAIEADLAKYACLEFHMMEYERDWVYLHANLMQQRRWELLQGANLFTMLREPVDCFLSWYFYAVMIRERIEPVLNKNGLPFPETLEQCMMDPATVNNQLAFLVGKVQLHGNLVDRSDLENAKKFLQTLNVHVGLTERFADSMNVFETVTGKRIPGSFIRNQNENPGRPRLDAVSQEVRDRISELCALDIELYEFGKQLFEEDFARCGPTPTYSFLSSPSTTKVAGDSLASARRAISFLVSSQLPGGEFQTQWRLSRRETEDGQVVERYVPFKCPFTSVLILYSLEFARELDPRVPDALQRGLEFLRVEMNPGGLWSYWTRDNSMRTVENGVPPDLDDTACISQLLRDNGISIPDNRWLFYDTQDERGAFYLWVYKANSFRKWLLSLRTFGKAFAHRQQPWYLHRDAVCAGVNANCIMYLGETSGTRRAIDYLLQIFRDKTEASATLYYTHPMSLYYLTSRAIAKGVHALAEAKPMIIERILASQQPDGSYGGDELLTAQAVCTLLNLETRPPRLPDSIAYLIGTQNPDGSWKRIPMYGNPPTPTGFGSADLTTGFCLEALARYGV